MENLNEPGTRTKIDSSNYAVHNLSKVVGVFLNDSLNEVDVIIPMCGLQKILTIKSPF